MSDRAEAIGYDPETETYLVDFDVTVESPSAVLVQALSVIEAVAVTEVERLYATVDPDYLDALVATAVDKAHGDVAVTFRHHEYEITVHSYGIIKFRVASVDGKPANGGAGVAGRG